MCWILFCLISNLQEIKNNYYTGVSLPSKHEKLELHVRVCNFPLCASWQMLYYGQL